MNGPWIFLLIFAAVWWISSRSGRGCGKARRNMEPEKSEVADWTAERLAEMSARLERLEEERDFYRDLLGSGTRFQKPVEPRSAEP